VHWHVAGCNWMSGLAFGPGEAPPRTGSGVLYFATRFWECDLFGRRSGRKRTTGLREGGLASHVAASIQALSPPRTTTHQNGRLPASAAFRFVLVLAQARKGNAGAAPPLSPLHPLVFFFLVTDLRLSQVGNAQKPPGDALDVTSGQARSPIPEFLVAHSFVLGFGALASPLVIID
jgi:hypothetical protein